MAAGMFLAVYRYIAYSLFVQWIAFPFCAYSEDFFGDGEMLASLCCSLKGFVMASIYSTDSPLEE